MNELDAAIESALLRVLERMEADPAEAEKRARRAALSIHRRPISPWRLALRASDTRIEQHAHVEDPELVRLRCPHRLLISSDTVLELCAPVRIPWPGMDWRVARQKLGLGANTMRTWIRKGVFQMDRWHSKRAPRRTAPTVPHVWTHALLDPAAPLGRAPDPIWGSLWQHLADDIPDDYCCELVRVGRFSEPNRAFAEVFRGWGWVCPGRLRRVPDGVSLEEALPGEEDAERGEIVERGGARYWWTPCERVVDVVYLPMPVWTAGEALGLGERLAEHGFALPADRRREPFACMWCWGMRRLTLANYRGWNDFVSYISGGVLYGHEVARATPEAQERRRRAFSRRPNRAPSARRAQVLEQILAGHSQRQIARNLGVSPSVVVYHLKRLLAEHGAGSRAELEGKVRRARAGSASGGGTAA